MQEREPGFLATLPAGMQVIHQNFRLGEFTLRRTSFAWPVVKALKKVFTFWLVFHDYP
ncbi:hypothetical protein D3C78_1993580 [compost metagenome]